MGLRRICRWCSKPRGARSVAGSGVSGPSLDEQHGSDLRALHSSEGAYAKGPLHHRCAMVEGASTAQHRTHAKSFRPAKAFGARLSYSPGNGGPGRSASARVNAGLADGCYGAHEASRAVGLSRSREEDSDAVHRTAATPRPAIFPSQRAGRPLAQGPGHPRRFQSPPASRSSAGLRDRPSRRLVGQAATAEAATPGYLAPTRS
jgi:hypothetical protein